MATHSSVLAWRISGTAEPGGLPSMGSHRVGHDWSDLAAAAAAAAAGFLVGSPGDSDGKEFTCTAGDLGSIPGSGRSSGGGHGNPVFLPGEFHGQRSLVGYSPWVCESVRHNQRTHSNKMGLLVLDLYSFLVYTTELPEEHSPSIFKKQ